VNVDFLALLNKQAFLQFTLNAQGRAPPDQLLLRCAQSINAAKV
jgi:hypothetical protein